MAPAAFSWLWICGCQQCFLIIAHDGSLRYLTLSSRLVKISEWINLFRKNLEPWSVLSQTVWDLWVNRIRKKSAALLAASLDGGGVGLRIFFAFFCEITKKKTCTHPLDPLEPPLSPLVPIRKGPIYGGPTRIWSRFFSFELF
jgi:hypothetical protein